MKKIKNSGMTKRHSFGSQIKICIVGIGGIGTHLLDNMSMFLNYEKEKLNFERIDIYLIDGDTIEEKNLERQTFNMTEFLGVSKTDKAEELMDRYKNLNFYTINRYVDENNVDDIIGESDIVMLCPDNHYARKVVSNHCSFLDNVVLINGGNGYYQGNSYTYIRRKGIDITPSLCDMFSDIRESQPEIINKDKSCKNLVKTDDAQLCFVNQFVATIMCCSLYNILYGNDLQNLSHLNLLTNTCLSEKIYN